jgi:ABC-type spermidine/putrescine transport system permease subunit II
VASASAHVRVRDLVAASDRCDGTPVGQHSLEVSTGLTARWHAVAWRDPLLREATLYSVRLALLTLVIAFPFGVGLALGAVRSRGRTAAIIRLLGVGHSALPETILASMLFSVVVHLFTVVPLGTGAQLLGHVTLALPYVTVVVSAALLSLDPACEEAAVDLGASTLGVLRYVVLPLLAPALLAVAMMCFTISLNDFVMSHFLCIDTDCATVPMLLYSRAPSVPDPTESAVAISQILFAMMTLGMALFLRRRFVARSSAHSQARTGADVSHRRLRRFS